LQRDGYAYLYEASHTTPIGFRPFLYSLVVLKPLLAFHSLMVVVVAQHVAALALGLTLYVLLRHLRVGGVLAAAGAAPVLLDGYQIDIEHYILTETFFEVVVVAAIVLLIWRARPSAAVVATAGVVLGLSALTRFVGITLIAPALIYVVLARLGWLRAMVLAAGFALPLVVFSWFFRTTPGGFGLLDRNGMFLYGRVAAFADCSKTPVPSNEKKLCIKTPPSRRGARYRSGFFRLNTPVASLRSERANQLMLRFSERMIRHQPWDYGKLVTSDFLRFFDSKPPPAREPYVAQWRFVSRLKDANPRPYVVARGGSPPRKIDRRRFHIARRLAGLLLTYQDAVYTYGPLLAVLLALGLIGAVVGAPPSSGRGLRPECALLALSALALLVGSVAATVYHFRYAIPALPLAGPAGALGASVLWRRYAERRARDESAVEPPASAQEDSGVTGALPSQSTP
jgi:4-amino-4-deoxy-L-arabinose transferase-like glycosyltransferase